MEPIGIRQNNPGNLRYGAGFDGEAEGDSGFGVYPDPVSGGTALIKNLVAYNQKHGLDTVSGIIGRWAPTNENNTAAYIDSVSADLGVSPDSPLNMQDPGTLAKLGAAIAKHEGNGRVFDSEFFNNLTSGNTELAAYVASQKLPTFSKQQARIGAYHANPQAPGEASPNVDDMSIISRVWDAPGVVENAAALQGAEQEALATRWAGMGESFWDAAQQNVTGRIYDLFQRGQPDANFKIGDEQFKQMGDAGIMPIKSLADFVSGAWNQEDFNRRLEIATERKDYFERASNTQGLAAFGNGLTGIVGSMADPVAIIATMGLGAAVAGARGAAFSLSRAAGLGAAENVAAGEIIRRADNQDFAWGDMVAQGVYGAGLGALGGLLARRASVGVDPVADAAARTVQDTMQSRLDAAHAQGVTGIFGKAGGLGTEIADFPTQRAVSVPEVDAASFGVLDGLRAEQSRLMGVAGNAAEPGTVASARAALQDLAANEPNLREITKGIQSSRGVSYKQALSEAKKQHAEQMLDWEDSKARLEQVVSRNTEAEGARTRLKEVENRIAELEAERKARGLLPTDRTKVAQAIHELMGSPKQSIFTSRPESTPANVRLDIPRPAAQVERVGSRQAGGSAVGAGREPSVRRTFSGEGNQVARFSRGEAGDGGFAEIQHARYQEFKRNGLIEEVHSGELEGLPADAKAVYVPEDGKVYVVRDRLTPEEAADPTGLIAHEIGVHYGLERVLGTEKYASVLGEVNRLAQTDPRMREALAAVPKDTPAGLVLEEALGYFAEKNTGLGPVARILAGIRSWLREHVPLFKNMGMTSNELIRMVQGSVEAARNPEVVAAAGAPRFSKTAEGQGTADSDRVQIRLEKVEQDITDRANAWDETVDPEGQKQQAALRKYYDGVREHAVSEGLQPWLDSPGLITARSKSKVVRYLGAHLFESATGLGKRTSSVALEYERMQYGYKWQAIPKLQELMLKGLTAEEKLQYTVGGGKAAENRVWREAAIEGQRHRAAIQAGTKYESAAPDYIQAIAKTLDDFHDKVTQDGLVAGNPMAQRVRGAGFVGHMPYEWSWERIAKAYRQDPTRFKSFYDNMKQQYVEKIVDPAIDKMAEVGPVQPADAAALRTRMMEKVANVVDNKVRVLMQDPKSRLDGMEHRFELIAADLLDENFSGTRLTPEVIKEFKDKLGDIRQDRSRTELDLVREVNGVSLLDFMDYNAVSMVTRGAHRWAGLNALARKGFTDLADAQAAKMAAKISGATEPEMKAIDFGFRAFGLGQVQNAERAGFNTARNFTFAAMMGKLSLSVLADLGNVVAVSGIRGFLSTIGTAFAKDKGLMEQLAKDAPSLLGQDYRLHSLTPDMSANGRVMVGEGSTLNRMSQRAAQFTSWVSPANLVQKMLHKGFMPVFAEDVLRTIRGENGGLTLRRLADLGIDRETMTRIKSQLDKYDAGRERGGRINWDEWDDQEAADRFIEGLHRGLYQTFQRAMVGEQPMWMTDSTVGSLVGQFRRYGLISAEKQLARNVAIGDVNAASAFALGTAWAGMLYYARMQMNTAGMTETEKQKYIDRNTKGFRLAAGVLNLLNMSGVLPDVTQMGEMLFGGTSYQQTAEPIAAMGYLGNLSSAANQLGSYLTGQGSDDHKQLIRSHIRILPGGNSIVGSYLANELTSDVVHGW